MRGTTGRVSKKPTTERTYEEMVWAAIHESGHAVAACRLGRGLKNKGVTIASVPGYIRLEDHTLGCCFSKGSRNDESRIIELFAGGAAELRAGAGATHVESGTASDAQYICLALVLHPDNLFLPGQKLFDPAVIVTAQILTKYKTPAEAIGAGFLGRGGSWTPSYIKELLNSQWFHCLARLAERAHVFVDENWSAIESLAYRLLQAQHMTGPEVHRFLRELAEPNTDSRPEVAA
jgi:hypothetical protein